jgi:hypothetical protein
MEGGQTNAGDALLKVILCIFVFFCFYEPRRDIPASALDDLEDGSNWQ